jgi:dTDP-4-amino-4,6-dideoxygalactose transaminase
VAAVVPRLGQPVGGFFALQTPMRVARSVYELWQLDPARHIMLGNARSALAALLRERRARRVWLPAYICEAAAEGAAAGAPAIDFYPVDERLEPDPAFLDRRLRRGDYVLGVDYFGRVPGARFRRLVAARRDIGWIEDRAQALSVRAAWGDWQLFSPRKLLGVPDGGIITGPPRATPRLPDAALAPPRIDGMLAVQAARLDDPACRRSHLWFPAYRRSEASQRVERAAISALTLALLHAADAGVLARRRAANWRVLRARLRDLAAFAGATGPAPYGFPIRVRDAGGLQEQLAARGVFAQRLWAKLPSPRRAFPEAHRLAGEVLTLPCDQRYAGRDMQSVARAVRDCMR